MKLSFGEQLPQLPTAHVAALQMVNLRLGFGIHGQEMHFPLHGPAVFGVTDREYAGFESIVENLDASRGDVLASEGIGHTDHWDFDEFMTSAIQNCDRSRRINLFSYGKAVSSYGTPVDDAIYIKLYGNQFLTTQEKLSQLFRNIREEQLINPIFYAQGLAALKEVPCRYADISLKQLQAIRNSSFLGRCGIGRLGRDQRMAEHLGVIANGMQQPTSETPTLAFMAGDGHRQGVEHILTAYEIPFISERISLSSSTIHTAMNGLKMMGRVLTAR